MHVDTELFSHIMSGKLIHFICDDGCITPYESSATDEPASLSKNKTVRLSSVVSYYITHNHNHDEVFV